MPSSIFPSGSAATGTYERQVAAGSSMMGGPGVPPPVETPSFIDSQGNPITEANSLIKFIEIDVDERPTGREYQFSINPSKLDVTMGKVEQYVSTKAGYERQGWQNDLIKVSYAGMTGAFLPNDVDVINGVVYRENGPRPKFDIRKSRAWKKFQSFQAFYLALGRNLVRMDCFVFDILLVGSLNAFKFGLDAETNASFIRYSFEFTGLPRHYPIVGTGTSSAMSPDSVGG